nr:MAG TPA: 26S proteasome non-ATPase regulatory subunit [Caudoviricetes sp.]
MCDEYGFLPLVIVTSAPVLSIARHYVNGHKCNQVRLVSPLGFQTHQTTVIL